MLYDKIIAPENARKAARILKQYCEQNGCLYCCFYHKEGNANFCALKTVPREYPEQYQEFVTQYDLIVPANSQANGQQMKPNPVAVPQQQPSGIQNYGAMQAAPMPPPPPQVENLPPPDPYENMLPFSMY